MSMRDEILARVRSGEMSTREAEDWAAENGEIFSTEPDPERFDPMTEPQWTLPMAAAWIIERSGEKVRKQWDIYRSGWLCWELLGPPDFGSELRAVGPANLDVFRRDVDPFEDDMRPFAHELCFALRSGQLSATGVSRARKVRVLISEFAWNGPFHRIERKTRPHAIYAVDADASSEERVYCEVRVPRDEVIAIWPPLAPSSITSSETERERIPPFKLAATLPPGFDRPDWTVEHVLAWLAHPNLAELRTLELTNPQRPKFYGRIYRRGFIDTRLEELLRGALIREKLIGREGENIIRRGGWWRERSLTNARAIWFRSDQVMRLWTGQRDDHGRVQVSTASANRGGRPPAVDWTVVKSEMLRLMDYHQDFGADSPEWNARARLEEALRNFCAKKFKTTPVNSTIQSHIQPWLADWRAAKRRSPET
jgi:hypothetical protein